MVLHPHRRHQWLGPLPARRAQRYHRLLSSRSELERAVVVTAEVVAVEAPALVPVVEAAGPAVARQGVPLLACPHSLASHALVGVGVAVAGVVEAARGHCRPTCRPCRKGRPPVDSAHLGRLARGTPPNSRDPRGRAEGAEVAGGGEMPNRPSRGVATAGRPGAGTLAACTLAPSSWAGTRARGCARGLRFRGGGGGACGGGADDACCVGHVGRCFRCDGDAGVIWWMRWPMRHSGR